MVVAESRSLTERLTPLHNQIFPLLEWVVQDYYKTSIMPRLVQEGVVERRETEQHKDRTLLDMEALVGFKAHNSLLYDAELEFAALCNEAGIPCGPGQVTLPYSLLARVFNGRQSNVHKRSWAAFHRFLAEDLYIPDKQVAWSTSGFI